MPSFNCNWHGIMFKVEHRKPFIIMFPMVPIKLIHVTTCSPFICLCGCTNYVKLLHCYYINKISNHKMPVHIKSGPEINIFFFKNVCFMLFMVRLV